MSAIRPQGTTLDGQHDSFGMPARSTGLGRRPGARYPYQPVSLRTAHRTTSTPHARLPKVMTRLDPRSSLVLDTRLVGRRPGVMHELTRDALAPRDLGTDVIRVEDGSALRLDIRMESVLEGVLVTGAARGVASGACVRCLAPMSVEFDGGFQELFAYADRHAHRNEVGDADAAEEYRVEDGLIDLDPVLRDTVVPALPFQPVCRPDCPGLCSECGVPLAEDPNHQHDVTDPRWAALSALAGSSS
ncbi:MAG: YceD family protein, partial [Dermatophilaceae bacterium]